MKIVNGKWALASLLISSMLLGGCFGPFKKKSSSGGGGGGGGSTETEDEEKDKKGKSNPTSGESPSNPSTPAVPGAKDGFGCLQGVVSDGFTGQPIAFDAAKIFVLIRGTKLTANKVDGVDGQYFICEIPGEETYPVYAFLDGYMPFESSVQITTTRAKRVAADGQAVIDEVKIADPLELQNIRLFPVGNTTRDLRVRAYYNGAPVKGAIVDLEAVAASLAGTFSYDGSFANSAGTRILPQRETTGDDGYATFDNAKLSLGAAYTVRVYPPIESNLKVVAQHANLVLGVSGAVATDTNQYEVTVELNDSSEMALKALACSTQFKSFDSSGSIKILFNRPVSIVDPDNMDGAAALGAATYVGAATDPLALATPITANNGASEQVTASVSGNLLTLTPKFQGNDTIKPLDNGDPNVAGSLNMKNKDAVLNWTLSAIRVKATGEVLDDNSDVASLVAALTCPTAVRFFDYID